MASFKQPSHSLDLSCIERPFHDRRDEVQRLAAKKVHGAEGFKKHRRGSGHAPLHHGIGNPLQQFKIFESERFGFRLGRESMGESSTDPVPCLSERCLGEGSHKCVERQSKSIMGSHYMKGLGESQFSDDELLGFLDRH